MADHTIIGASFAEPKGLGPFLWDSHFEVTEELVEDWVDPEESGAQGLGPYLWDPALDQPNELEAAELYHQAAEGWDPTWNELTDQMIRASVSYFAQEILTGPPEPPYFGKFLVGELHEEWDDLVQEYDRLCVLAARDHGKTYFFDFAYPLWKIVTQSGGLGYIFSNTKEQAIRILEDIKTEIANNPHLQHLKPVGSSGKRWAQTAIHCTNGHRIYARGFGVKVRGGHPNWCVVDDGLNDETLYSEMVRRKQIDYFYSALSNMIIPGGQLIVVGTPFHQEDLYADLGDNSRYKYGKYAAVRPNGGALCPDRYNLRELGAKKEEIGSVRFTREFMCEPIADDMSLFPGWLFAGDPIEQWAVTLGRTGDWWRDEVGVSIYMGVDFALSSSVQADYTVIWVMGVDKMGNRWIIDIHRGKGIPYQQQLSKIAEVAKLYEPGLIFLEANQAQRIFGDELIRTTDLPIKLFRTGVEKHSLEKGVPSLRVLLENGKFRIPRGDARSVELTNLWRDEMRSFTWQNGKLASVGGHDDLVMACWICDQAIRAGGFSFAFGLEDGEDGQLSHQDILAELTGDRGDGASGDLIDDEGPDPMVMRLPPGECTIGSWV